MKQGMGISLLLTRYWPGRFDRFAERILGPGATLDDRETLKNQLDQVLDQYKQVKDLEERVASQSILEGYGRLDALNRIGNQVFLNRPEEAGKLRRLVRAGAFSADLEHAVVRLGAV